MSPDQYANYIVDYDHFIQNDRIIYYSFLAFVPLLFGKHQDINSVRNFVELFPGNTCDMSMAQQNSFYHVLDLYTQTEFGVIVNQTTELSQIACCDRTSCGKNVIEAFISISFLSQDDARFFIAFLPQKIMTC